MAILRYLAFGKRLKALRKSKEATQEDLGMYLGLSTMQIRRYESGVCLPGTAHLVNIANFFKMSVADLTEGDLLCEGAEVIRRLKPYVLAYIAYISQAIPKMEKQVYELRVKSFLSKAEVEQLEDYEAQLEDLICYQQKIWKDLKDVGG